MQSTKLNNIPELNLITENKNISNDITGIFSCDLLSHVMGFANEGNILLTVLNNINVLGVASLMDLSCVIFTHNIEVNNSIVEKANELEIPLYKTKLSTADMVILLNKMGANN